MSHLTVACLISLLHTYHHVSFHCYTHHVSFHCYTHIITSHFTVTFTCIRILTFTMVFAHQISKKKNSRIPPCILGSICITCDQYFHSFSVIQAAFDLCSQSYLLDIYPHIRSSSINKKNSSIPPITCNLHFRSLFN